MKTFADIAIPVFVAIEIAAMAGAFAITCRRMRQAAGHCRRNPVPLRVRLRERRRLAWYRLTRRMPGKCPRRDPFRLTDEDRGEFGGIAILYRERGISADEPERTRRLP